MDMDVAYAGDMNFTINVAGLRTGIDQIRFKGRLRAILRPLIPEPPMVGGVSAFFLDPPTMDWNLSGIGNAGDLPGLSKIIRNIVDASLASFCVLPQEIVIPLSAAVDPLQTLLAMPDGLIRVHLVEARNLEALDIALFQKGKSDPYAKLAVGAQKFQSKTIDNNLDPKWNQFWDAVADHANGQRLIVEVFDEDPSWEDEFLGR